MGSGQQGWEEGRLWNIFPITSGMLLHCLQPCLADSGFPGLVPRGNKSRSCSHPRPPRGTNLNQELLEPKEGAGATGKPATCWSCWIFPHCAFLLMLDPCAQPDSRLWERGISVACSEIQLLSIHPNHHAGLWKVPFVDGFQLRFLISSHQRMQTASSSTFPSAALALCFTPVLSSLAQCPVASIWGLFLEWTWDCLEPLQKNSGHSFDHGADKLNSVLTFMNYLPWENNWDFAHGQQSLQHFFGMAWKRDAQDIWRVLVAVLAKLVWGVAVFWSNLFFGGKAELLTFEFRGIFKLGVDFSYGKF